jgi:hypothetical protein
MEARLRVLPAQQFQDWLAAHERKRLAEVAASGGAE